MEKLFGVLFLLVAVEAANKHHPKFPPMMPEEIRKVPCSSDHEAEHELITKEAKCGPPKDFFYHLNTESKTLEITPSAVWVKRCIGTCDSTSGSSCVPTEKVIRYIPVRLYNETTRKDSCALFPVEEHVACACCALSADKCAPPRVFSARKCACSCPEPRARARCLAQGNMKWNRRKCQCEEKKDAYPRRFKADPFGMSRRSRGAIRGFK